GVSHGQVSDAVAIEVPDGHGERGITDDVAGSRPEGTVALAQEHVYRVASDGKIGDTIVVQIRDRKAGRNKAHGVVVESLETAVALAQRDTDGVRRRGRYRQVGDAVAIEILDCYSKGCITRIVAHGWAEGAVPLTQQNTDRAHAGVGHR